jgi:hypothetical protein
MGRRRYVAREYAAEIREHSDERPGKRFAWIQSHVKFPSTNAGTPRSEQARTGSGSTSLTSMPGEIRRIRVLSSSRFRCMLFVKVRSDLSVRPGSTSPPESTGRGEHAGG